jgi:hypothetical protein
MTTLSIILLWLVIAIIAGVVIGKAIKFGGKE